MEVIVTGGAEFIGSAVVGYLVRDKGVEVANVDCLTYVGNLENVAPVSEDARYRFFRTDIRDCAGIGEVIAATEPDAIVYLAAVCRGRPVTSAPALLFGGRGQLEWELRQTLRALGPVVTPGREAADFTRRAGLSAVVAEARPSLVANAAAYTDVDGVETEEVLAHAIHGEAPGVIAAAAQAGAPVIHFSMGYVFDGTRSDRPYKEDDPVNPVSAYGRTKRASEVAVQEFGSAHLIFRVAWLYSGHGRNFMRTIALSSTAV